MAVGYLTTYGANSVLSGVAMPTTWHAKGHLGNPGIDALLLPAAETRRVPLVMDAPAAGAAVNEVGTVASAAATEVFAYLSLWDDSFAGNPWWVVSLLAPVNIVLGNTIRIPASSLLLSFTLWS
jgi:hypothetical protein